MNSLEALTRWLMASATAPLLLMQLARALAAMVAVLVWGSLVPWRRAGGCR